MTKPKTILQINKLELSVHLGWTENERVNKQTVLLDAQIAFPHPPKACTTDSLTDTICYRELTDHLRQTIADKQFTLLEHLTSEIHRIIKEQLPHKSKLSVSVTKYPAIIDLRDGVTFRYEDE